MIKSIHMVVLPHKQMRSYPDCGDWFTSSDGEPIMLATADTGNDFSNLAVLLHEFIESVWCWKNGISEQSVTEFDRKWFAEHPNSNEEPGHDKNAPYHIGHVIAERFENEFLTQMGKMWSHHEEAIGKLYG